MDFLIILLVTCVAVFVLAKPIARFPLAFYVLSIVLVIALFAGSAGYLGTYWKPLIILLQRCMLPLALFTIVMFIGAFSKSSWVGKKLRPIRAELSIIACLLCLGHVCQYLTPYLSRALEGSMSASMATSFAISMGLLVLLVVLGITSFGFVKKHMSTALWKNVQRFAYLFFGLIYLHLIFMIAPAALHGGKQAILSVVIYSTIFLAYAIARLVFWRKQVAQITSTQAAAQTNASLASDPLLDCVG